VRFSVILAVGSFLLAIGASAQVREPTEREIERAKQQYRQPTDAEVEAASKRYRMPSAAELDRAAASQSPVNVDAIPQPKGRVDVEALARAYESNRQAFGRSPLVTDEPALLVFVTLGMPEATLRLLIGQAAQAHAVLMLRGLQNASIRETAARVQQLIGQSAVEFQIDPQAFDRFGVRVAPTFVLVKPGARVSDCAAGACVAPDAFASITGDVSIAYALETIAQRAPPFRADVELFLQRIRG
jgi:conjugal transfer pilus assembly protein TrbC